MKILHVGEYVQGGVATYIRTLLHHSSEDFDEYLMLANEKSEHIWPLDENKIIYYNYQRSFLCVLKTIPRILRAVKNIRPDIIYCHSTWAGLMVRIPFLLKKKHPPIIYNAHGWAFLRDTASVNKKIYAMIEKILARSTACIINVSKYELNSALYYGLPIEKLHLLYSGISEERNLVDSIDMSNDNIKLLFVGRLDPQKGVDLLVRAMKQTKRKDVHLILIGDNVVKENDYIEKINTDNMTFLGWLSHKDIGKYYAACDAVVMPSRWEAFGLVAVEAMKYGKAVIASKNGALPELIEDKVNGLLCDFEDPEIIEYLPKDKNVLKKMGGNGRKIFLEKFTADKMLYETLKCYKSVMNCNSNI